MDKSRAIFQHLGLVLLNQHQGAPDAADAKRFVSLIKNQNREIYHIA